MFDHKTEMTAVQKTVLTYRESLYQVLAEIYAFCAKSADADDSSHSSWKKYAAEEYENQGWTFTEGSFNNIFTPAVRIAFNADPTPVNDGGKPELDAAPISKYAKALEWMYKKDGGYIGLEKDGDHMVAADTIVDDAKQHISDNGISALYAAATKKDDDDNDSLDKLTQAGKDALDEMLPSIPSVSYPEFGGKPGYALAIVHVDSGNKIHVIGTVAGEDDDDTKRVLREYAPTNPFKELVEIIRFADVAKGLGKKTRPIVIDNQANRAVIRASLAKDIQSIVASAEVPHIDALGTGKFILKQGSAEAIKHLWANGEQDWEWR